MARIAGYATSGLAPKLLLMTPVESIRKLLKRTGWRLEDVDLFEINEAFAAQMVAIIKELGLDRGARQRQRRRDCARSPDRRERRARADDVAVRHEGAGRAARNRLVVSGRRERSGAGGGDVTKNEERKARDQRVSVLYSFSVLRFRFQRPLAPDRPRDKQHGTSTQFPHARLDFRG